jgi:hypothetical protein
MACGRGKKNITETLSENIILKKFKNYPRNDLQPRQAPQKVWTRFLIPIIN